MRAFRSAGLQHDTGPVAYPQTPPTSGTHAGRWADWGVYDQRVPHRFQVHNLEHGGVVVHLGRSSRGRAVDRLGAFVAREPGYLVVAPRASNRLIPAERRLRRFPERGIVATSWQRRIVCRRVTRKSIDAVQVYIRRYRGTGPEQAPAVDSTTERPPELPAPARPAAP